MSEQTPPPEDTILSFDDRPLMPLPHRVAILSAETRLLRQQLAALCNALLRKDTEHDGNWGHPAFYDEVRQIAQSLKEPR